MREAASSSYAWSHCCVQKQITSLLAATRSRCCTYSCCAQSGHEDHRWTSNGKIKYEKCEKQFPHIVSLCSNIINSSNSKSCTPLCLRRESFAFFNTTCSFPPRAHELLLYYETGAFLPSFTYVRRTEEYPLSVSSQLCRFFISIFT